MPKNGPFWRVFLKTCSLLSNSVTRQVSFNNTKLVENAKIKKLKCDIFGNFQTLWSKSNNCCYQYCAAKSNKKDQLEYSWKKMVYYNSKPRTSNEGPCYDASIWFRSVSWLFLQLGFAPLRHLRFTTLEVEFPRELVQARAILIFRQKMGKSNEGNSISLACQQRNSLRLNFTRLSGAL